MQKEEYLSTKTQAFFIELDQKLSDPRDNRGKRHNLAFVMCGVLLGIMAGRAQVSSIHRYIRHKIVWLRKITGQDTANPVSRAQLPRILAVVNWAQLNEISEKYFGFTIGRTASSEWYAIDGKTLRGTDGANERIVTAVGHTSRQTQGHRGFGGEKEEERGAVRTLLHETGLEQQRVTMDALHLVPKTTAQINQAGGKFIVQVKNNQPTLYTLAQTVELAEQPLGRMVTTNVGHGRQEKRQATLFDVSAQAFALRWQTSHFQTLIVMNRLRTEISKQKTTSENSYYLSNVAVSSTDENLQKNLMTAVRQHWGVESENWIRDVTFGEDGVKTKNKNQAQVMAGLRTLSLQLFRKAKVRNFRAALERFADCPDKFETFLLKVGFL